MAFGIVIINTDPAKPSVTTITATAEQMKEIQSFDARSAKQFAYTFEDGGAWAQCLAKANAEMDKASSTPPAKICGDLITRAEAAMDQAYQQKIDDAQHPRTKRPAKIQGIPQIGTDGTLHFEY